MNPNENSIEDRKTLRRGRHAPASVPLTDLPGGPGLLQETERRLGLKESVALLHVDIDGFKTFNDVSGRAAGAHALRAAAGAIKGAAPKGAFAAHIGGGGFALLCREGQARTTAEAVCRAFDDVPGAVHGVSLSIGAALSSTLEQPSYTGLATRAVKVKALCNNRSTAGSRWAW